MRQINAAQFENMARHAEAFARRAGKIDAEALIREGPEEAEEAADYDLNYVKESMSLEEAIRGDAGDRLYKQLRRLWKAEAEGEIIIPLDVVRGDYRTGWRRMEPINVIEYRALVEYIEAWDSAVRAAGLVPTYMRED